MEPRHVKNLFLRSLSCFISSAIALQPAISSAETWQEAARRANAPSGGMSWQEAVSDKGQISGGNTRESINETLADGYRGRAEKMFDAVITATPNKNTPELVKIVSKADPEALSKATGIPVEDLKNSMSKSGTITLTYNFLTKETVLNPISASPTGDGLKSTAGSSNINSDKVAQQFSTDGSAKVVVHSPKGTTVVVDGSKLTDKVKDAALAYVAKVDSQLPQNNSTIANSNRDALGKIKDAITSGAENGSPLVIRTDEKGRIKSVDLSNSGVDTIRTAQSNTVSNKSYIAKSDSKPAVQSAPVRQERPSTEPPTRVADAGSIGKALDMMHLPIGTRTRSKTEDGKGEIITVNPGQTVRLDNGAHIRAPLGQEGAIKIQMSLNPQTGKIEHKVFVSGLAASDPSNLNNIQKTGSGYSLQPEQKTLQRELAANPYTMHQVADNKLIGSSGSPEIKNAQEAGVTSFQLSSLKSAFENSPHGQSEILSWNQVQAKLQNTELGTALNLAMNAGLQPEAALKLAISDNVANSVAQAESATTLIYGITNPQLSKETVNSLVMNGVDLSQVQNVIAMDPKLPNVIAIAVKKEPAYLPGLLTQIGLHKDNGIIPVVLATARQGGDLNAISLFSISVSPQSLPVAFSAIAAAANRGADATQLLNTLASVGDKGGNVTVISQVIKGMADNNVPVAGITQFANAISGNNNGAGTALVQQIEMYKDQGIIPAVQSVVRQGGNLNEFSRLIGTASPQTVQAILPALSLVADRGANVNQILGALISVKTNSGNVGMAAETLIGMVQNNMTGQDVLSFAQYMSKNVLAIPTLHQAVANPAAILSLPAVKNNNMAYIAESGIKLAGGNAANEALIALWVVRSNNIRLDSPELTVRR